MDWRKAAEGFGAMGSDARLRVLRCLVRAGEEGLSVGEVQLRTGIAASTLNHHLRSLTAAGLIAQERVGRTVVNRAAFTELRALADFLLDECCADAAGKDTENG